MSDLNDSLFEEVRLHLTYEDGGSEYLPRAGQPRMTRWFAEWLLANEIAVTGAYKGRRVAKALIVSI